MADIFEIHGVNAELKIGEKTYKFADPIFRTKVLLQKKIKDLKAKKDTMEEDVYLLEMYDLTGKMIQQYLPSLDDATLESIGDYARQALLERLTTLAETKFGAVVSQVDAK